MATASPSSVSEYDRGRCSADTPDQKQAQARIGPPRSRGQSSPTATLVAVAAIGLGLSLYASVLGSVAPVPDHDVAGPTLDRVHDAITSADIADPEQLGNGATVGPDGYQLRVSLRADGRIWAAGPTPPNRTDMADTAITETAVRSVPVRMSAGAVVSGRLRVVVWG